MESLLRINVDKVPSYICIINTNAIRCYDLNLEYDNYNDEILDIDKNIISIKEYSTSSGNIVIREYKSGLLYTTYRDKKLQKETILLDNVFIYRHTGLKLFTVNVNDKISYQIPISKVQSILPDEYVLLYINNPHSYSYNTWRIIKKENAKFFN